MQFYLLRIVIENAAKNMKLHQLIEVPRALFVNYHGF
jgi:hypothetical protein